MRCYYDEEDLMWALDETESPVDEIVPLSLLGIGHALLNPETFRDHPRYYDGGTLTLAQAHQQLEMTTIRERLEGLENTGKISSFRGRDVTSLFPGLRPDRTYYVDAKALARRRSVSPSTANSVVSDLDIVQSMFTMVTALSDKELESMCERLAIRSGGRGTIPPHRIRTVIKKYREKTCSASTRN